ncbi:MAG: DUF3024 domain-containing protein [Gammaproteobacteria bacterium]|nr:DUF3024 domain-containing protein [Gammaproteobacteria bacterium]
MPLSEFEHERIEKVFQEYCDAKVPAQARDQLRVTYKVKGDEVKLFECRPNFRDPDNWSERAVARFKKDGKKHAWQLYCADRNGKWHLYDPFPESNDIKKLLAEVEHDPTGIFLG